jgi:hypothetical protein
MNIRKRKRAELIENNKRKRRIIQEKIAQMIRDGILEASSIENGEPILEVTAKALIEREEEEILEKDLNNERAVGSLIRKFLKSDSDYGEITNIKQDIVHIYDLIKEYVLQNHLDIYALKLQDKIILSRTNFEFEKIQKVVKNHSNLILEIDMIEIWDDLKNKILHLLILPLRKHFPISYNNGKSKLEKVELILKSIPR